MTFSLSLLIHLITTMRGFKRIRQRLREELKIKRAALKLFEEPSYMAPGQNELPIAVEGRTPTYVVWMLPRGGTYRFIDGVMMPTEVMPGDQVKRVTTFNVLDFTGAALASDDLMKVISQEFMRSRRVRERS